MIASLSTPQVRTGLSNHLQSAPPSFHRRARASKPNSPTTIPTESPNELIPRIATLVHILLGLLALGRSERVSRAREDEDHGEEGAGRFAAVGAVCWCARAVSQTSTTCLIPAQDDARQSAGVAVSHAADGMEMECLPQWQKPTMSVEVGVVSMLLLLLLSR